MAQCFPLNALTNDGSVSSSQAFQHTEPLGKISQVPINV